MTQWPAFEPKGYRSGHTDLVRAPAWCQRKLSGAVRDNVAYLDELDPAERELLLARLGSLPAPDSESPAADVALFLTCQFVRYLHDEGDLDPSRVRQSVDDLERAACQHGRLTSRMRVAFCRARAMVDTRAESCPMQAAYAASEVRDSASAELIALEQLTTLGLLVAHLAALIARLEDAAAQSPRIGSSARAHSPPRLRIVSQPQNSQAPPLDPCRGRERSRLHTSSRRPAATI